MVLWELAKTSCDPLKPTQGGMSPGSDPEYVIRQLQCRGHPQRHTLGHHGWKQKGHHRTENGQRSPVEKSPPFPRKPLRVPPTHVTVQPPWLEGQDSGAPPAGVPPPCLQGRPRPPALRLDKLVPAGRPFPRLLLASCLLYFPCLTFALKQTNKQKPAEAFLPSVGPCFERTTASSTRTTQAPPPPGLTKPHRQTRFLAFSLYRPPRSSPVYPTQCERAFEWPLAFVPSLSLGVTCAKV